MRSTCKESGSTSKDGNESTDSQKGPGRLSELDLSSRTLASGGGNNRRLIFLFTSLLRSQPNLSPGLEEASELVLLAAQWLSEVSQRSWLHTFVLEEFLRA